VPNKGAKMDDRMIEEFSRRIDELEKHNSKELNRVFRKGVLIGTLTTLLFSITVAMVLFIGFFSVEDFSAELPIQEREEIRAIENLDPMEKLHEIEEIIRGDFLFMDEVSDDELIEGIFYGFVNALGDPYTVYFNQEVTRQLTEQRQGSYYGIGAALRPYLEGNGVEIVRTFEGSPAGEVGLMSGDIIIQVDDRIITDQDLQEVVSWIRGEIGTTVDLTVNRNGEEFFFTVERANIQVPSVAHEMLEDNIGYIVIESFDMLTGGQFEEAMTELDELGMEGLIIDLRFNPGGSWTVVVEILNDILPQGLIVTREDVHGNVTAENSDGDNVFDRPMVVLVNEYSASAAEIFAGAVQDQEIATIVGTTTFGKGLVQSVFILRDGSSMNVTVAEYFTPNRQRINETGIVPDVEVEFDFQQEVEDEEDIVDAQLDRAIEIIMEKL
jgi:carboxyl-terminal processing protease